MEHYQSIILAECVIRDRQERAQRAADRWHLTGRRPPQPTLRETLADALIALALRLAPQHMTISTSRQSPVVSRQ